MTGDHDITGMFLLLVFLVGAATATVFNMIVLAVVWLFL